MAFHEFEAVVGATSGMCDPSMATNLLHLLLGPLLECPSSLDSRIATCDLQKDATEIDAYAEPLL